MGERAEVELISALVELSAAVAAAEAEALELAREVRATIDRDLAALPDDVDSGAADAARAACEQAAAVGTHLAQFVTVSVAQERIRLQNRIESLERYERGR